MRDKNRHLGYYERSGLFSVIGLLLLFSLVRAGQGQSKFKMSEEHIHKADSLAMLLSSSNKNWYIQSPKKSELNLRSFDPNTVSEGDLLEMGIRPALVSNLLAYREKVGNFQSVHDLKRLYNMRNEEYEILRPHIQLSKRKTTRRETQEIPNYQESNPKELNLDFPYMDLNSCDTTELKEIRGIGSFYAKRIIRFRDALGGFHQLDQVKETRNLPDSVYQKIKPHLYLAEPIFHHIKVNSMNEEEIRKHPYINYQEARAIVRYRDQHGEFRSIGDLKKIHLLKDKDMKKLMPYISFD